jgi:hypothetical protein
LSCAVLDTVTDEIVVTDFPDRPTLAGKFEIPHSGA